MSTPIDPYKANREILEDTEEDFKTIWAEAQALPWAQAQRVRAALNRIDDLIRGDLGECVGTCGSCESRVYEDDTDRDYAGYVGEEVFCFAHYRDMLKSARESYAEAVARGEIVEGEFDD